MEALSLQTSHMIVHHIFRPPPPPSLVSFFILKPLQAVAFRGSSSFVFTHPFRRSRLLSHVLSGSVVSISSSAPAPIPHSLSEPQTLLEDPIDTLESYDEDSDEIGSENGDEEFEGSKTVLHDSTFSKAKKEPVLKLPVLTVKERKELASYAHGLGKKLKNQQVGKSGVTESVVTALIETLEANELLKLKIHGTCPGELEDVVKQLERATGSVVVSQIGRSVILYRPSLTKLKAEERRKQGQRVALRKQSPSRTSLQAKFQRKAQAPGPRLSGRGRRGSSRY